MDSEAKHLSVLAITSEVPWPLDSGGHLRTYHLLRQLAAEHDVTLVVPGQERGDVQFDAIREAGIRLRLVPGARPGPVGQGVAALVAAAQREPYVMYRRHYRASVASAVRAHIAKEPPDVLYFDHLDAFVYPDCPGATTVGDLHNVYSKLLVRTAEDQTSRIWRWYLSAEARRLAVAERVAAERASLLMTVSALDQEHFQSLGATDVAVVPNGVDCNRYLDLPVGRGVSPPVIMFLGAMSWAPNVSAAEFLARAVLPRVRTHLPDVRLQIVGRDPSDRVRALAADPSVEVTGAVDDVRRYLAGASMLAVPLTAGGGTRLKILEAFAAGLPVVSTSVGCEGIEAEDGVHLIVAESSAFADAVSRALSEPARLTTLAEAARRLALERYDWATIGRLASRAIVNARTRDLTCSAK